MKQKNYKLLYLLSICLLFTVSVSAEPEPPKTFTKGNLVILRYGDGTAEPESGKLVPLFLDEYTKAGVWVQSIPLPTASVGSQRALTGYYSNASNNYEGAINRSVDKSYIVVAGYEGVHGENRTNDIPRVIGRISASGDINTTTAFAGGIFSAPRSAITVDGTEFWICGTADQNIGGNGGVRVFSLGVNATLSNAAMTDHGARLGGANTSFYTYIFKEGTFGQLYYSNGNAVRTLGTGVPSSGTGHSTPTLSGFESGNRPDPLQFVMFDTNNDDNPDLMFMVNNGNKNSFGQIAKYVLTGGTWVHKGGIAIDGKTENTKFLTAEVTGGVATIYTSTYGNTDTGTPSAVYKITNTLTNDLLNADFNLTPIITAPVNTVFRGIAFTPETTTNPVKLSSFDATKDNEKVVLRWETQSETNNDYFEILRSSDKDNFVAISTVKGKGNQGGSYGFIDHNPLNGMNYYQLKQFDKDGTEELLGIKAVSFSLTTNAIRIYPNPSVNEFTASLSVATTKPLNLVIYDNNGKTIYSKDIPKGQQQIPVAFAAKPKPGIYFVHVEGFQTTKLQVE